VGTQARDESDELLPAREFRRCVQCLSLATRRRSATKWDIADDPELLERLRFPLSRL
jgi:hypothetical protein